MEITNEILPKELLETLNWLSFGDEDGVLIIESVEFLNDDIVLLVSIRYYDNVVKELWEVTAKTIEYEKITREWTISMEAYSEHTLLLDYNDDKTELYFKGTTENADVLFINLFQSMLQLSNDMNHISKYILPLAIVKKLNTHGDGLFARGPKTFLNLYADCLSRQGIKPIFIGEYKTIKLLKLLILGSSYFVAEDFLFNRKILAI